MSQLKIKLKINNKLFCDYLRFFDVTKGIGQVNTTAIIGLPHNQANLGETTLLNPIDLSVTNGQNPEILIFTGYIEKLNTGLTTDITGNNPVCLLHNKNPNKVMGSGKMKMVIAEFFKGEVIGPDIDLPAFNRTFNSYYEFLGCLKQWLAVHIWFRDATLIFSLPKLGQFNTHRNINLIEPTEQQYVNTTSENEIAIWNINGDLKSMATNQHKQHKHIRITNTQNANSLPIQQKVNRIFTAEVDFFSDIKIGDYIIDNKLGALLLAQQQRIATPTGLTHKVELWRID